MKPTGPSNYYTRELIRTLWKTKRNVWKRVSEVISKPSRDIAEMNLFRLNKITKENDVVVVPGKILGSGKIDHPIVIGTFKISSLAKEKLANANCKVMTIAELLEKYPTGSGVRILI